MSSFTRLLDQTLAQDQGDWTTKQETNTTGPKRYKSPTLLKSVLQITLHGFFGALFAQSVVTPLLSERDINPVIIYHTICSCTILSSLTYITFNKNELSPRGQTVQKIWSALWDQIQSSGFLFYFVTLPPFCLLGICWFQGESLSLINSVHALLIAFPTTLFMSLYIVLSDITLSVILMQPGLNVDRFISQNLEVAADGCEVEDVLVEVILGGLGVGLLEYIISPHLKVDKDGKLSLPTASKKRRFDSAQMQVCDLEEEEMRRNDAMTFIVKTSVEKGQICGYTSFEDDLLKMNFLESFGGSSDPNPANPLGLSQRHYRSISQRIAAEAAKAPAPQPAMVPVLRALSAYLGGIGLALSDSGSSLFVSPCMTVAVEYAVMAASRFIIFNMIGNDSGGNSQKRYNRMSLMLPIVLESIYRLRCGLLDCAHHAHERESRKRNGNITVERGPGVHLRKRGARVYQAADRLNNELALDETNAHVVNVCNEAAALILQTLREVDGGSDFEAGVRIEGCRNWLNSLE